MTGTAKYLALGGRTQMENGLRMVAAIGPNNRKGRIEMGLSLSQELNAAFHRAANLEAENTRLRDALRRIVNDSDIQCRNPNYNHENCPLQLAREALEQ